MARLKVRTNSVAKITPTSKKINWLIGITVLHLTGTVAILLKLFGII